MRTWQTIHCASLARHTHEGKYAAVVLDGAFEEAGDQGRFRVQAGDVVLHDRFEAHLDRFSPAGARVLNLALPAGREFSPGVARVADLDLVVRVAETDRTEAAQLLLGMVEALRTSAGDWPEELAEALVQNSSLRLSDWAAEKGLASWTVSRGFAAVFGISPEAFRARARARRAWKAIHVSSEPLANIAAALGFADQSHMTRSVKRVTGMAPQWWRRAANGCKTRHALSV
jgi:AraC-like DNA-binding protein